MNCDRCGSRMQKNGKTPEGRQKWRCISCKYNYEEKKAAVPAVPQEIKVGISESQLRARHDNRYIIENKCKELKPGIFMTNSEFINWCCIKPGMGYRGIIDHPDYDKFHGKAGSIIYWSHPESIKKLRDEGVLT